VNIAKEPAPFAETHADLIGRFARFGLPGLKVGHRVFLRCRRQLES
jgi:hypothetical protein